MDQDIEVLPRARRALAGIGGRYLFSDDAAGLLAAGAGLGPARDDINRALPWPVWLPTPARRRLAHHQAHFGHRLQQVIECRRAEGGVREDLLGQMMRPSS